MRSNFIKELESCTVTFQGPFRKRPNGILTVCDCKLAHVCVQEGMNEPASSLGGLPVVFSGVIFHRHECSMPIELARSAPSGWQRSGEGCHAHPFQLRTEKPDGTTVNVCANRTSTFTGKVSNRGLSFPLTWPTEVQRTVVPLERAKL